MDPHAEIRVLSNIMMRRPKAWIITVYLVIIIDKGQNTV